MRPRSAISSEYGEERDDTVWGSGAFAVVACSESSCAAAVRLSLRKERQNCAQSCRGGHAPEKSYDAGAVDCKLHSEGRDRAPGSRKKLSSVSIAARRAG